MSNVLSHAITETIHLGKREEKKISISPLPVRRTTFPTWAW